MNEDNEKKKTGSRLFGWIVYGLAFPLVLIMVVGMVMALISFLLHVLSIPERFQVYIYLVITVISTILFSFFYFRMLSQEGKQRPFIDWEGLGITHLFSEDGMRFLLFFAAVSFMIRFGLNMSWGVSFALGLPVLLVLVVAYYLGLAYWRHWRVSRKYTYQYHEENKEVHCPNCQNRLQNASERMFRVETCTACKEEIIRSPVEFPEEIEDYQDDSVDLTCPNCNYSSIFPEQIKQFPVYCINCDSAKMEEVEEE